MPLLVNGRGFDYDMDVLFSGSPSQEQVTENFIDKMNNFFGRPLAVLLIFALWPGFRQVSLDYSPGVIYN